MTAEQKATVEKFFEDFKSHCQEYVGYNTSNYCSFETLRNEENKEDTNIVVIMSTIVGTTDYGIPETEIKNFFIEPNGKFYEMDMMPEVFKNRREVVSYLQKLKKFDWNAE
jgi:hypothetical protein